MTLRYSLVVYLIGILVDLFGALMKILHLPFADQVLIIGGVLQTVGIMLDYREAVNAPQTEGFSQLVMSLR